MLFSIKTPGRYERKLLGAIYSDFLFLLWLHCTFSTFYKISTPCNHTSVRGKRDTCFANNSITTQCAFWPSSPMSRLRGFHERFNKWTVGSCSLDRWGNSGCSLFCALGLVVESVAWFGSAISGTTVLALSVDRFLAVYMHLRYNEML